MSEMLSFEQQCHQPIMRRDSNGKKTVTRFRITVLGSPGVGKSALTVRYVTNRFLHEYDPAANVYSKELAIRGRKTELQIFDVSTQHDDDEDGNDSSDTFCAWSDGFVLVYSVTDATSLKSAVEMKREIDLRRKFRPAHFILVGNKSDLVQHRRVSERDGRSAAESLGCCFTEASARDGMAIEDTFERAVRTVGTKLRRNSIIGVISFSSPQESRRKKIPFLSKAKARLGNSTPLVLTMGLSGKRLSVYSEPRPLTMKAITTLRRASVA